MKAIRRLLCGLLALGLLAGCSGEGVTESGDGRADAEDQPIGDSIGESAEADAEADAGGEPAEPEPFAHSAVFDLDLAAGNLTAELCYAPSDKLGGAFLLNRGFAVDAILRDGEEVAPIATGVLFDGYFPVNRYEVPDFADSLVIRYSGTIDSSARFTTYSRESVSEAFTLLRWESFCYPLFADELYGLFDFLDPDEPLRARISVRAPEGFTVAAPYPLLGREADGGAVVHHLDGDLADLSLAVAEYDLLELPSGVYYFLPGADLEAMEALISPIMAEAEAFLSERFGAAEVPDTMRYIAIPRGYGGWAINGKAVFLDESAFDSTYEMRQLVHEFIHLGWNPKFEHSNRVVARSRFFDEGYAMYLQTRVLGHLMGEEVYRSEIEGFKTSLRGQYGPGYDALVPLVQYGTYELGLSYQVGPILFDELAALVGEERLDEATAEFLRRYRDTPVDFEIFCSEYTELCGDPALEAFFEDWIYSAEGLRRVLRGE